jgi:hypothetical protein
MKIIIFAADFASTHQLMLEIKKSDHLVLETVDEPDQLVHVIARTTPHLLVAHASAESEAGQFIQGQVRILFPHLNICLLSGDLSTEQDRWQPALQEVLAHPIRPPTPRPYAEDARLVPECPKGMRASAMRTMRRWLQAPLKIFLGVTLHITWNGADYLHPLDLLNRAYK